jgi:hypothetical protein
MISEETTADSSFDSDNSSSIESISRRELEIRYHLQELANVRLRRRLSRLEEIHNLGLLNRTDTVQSRRNDLLEELDAIKGRSDG